MYDIARYWRVNTVQQSLFPYEYQHSDSVSSSAKEKNGAVYTKSWVVEMILDLVGYRPDQRLFEKILIEPSAGDGAFLTAILKRLLLSCELHGTSIEDCEGAIVAYELDKNSALAAQTAIRDVLTTNLVTEDRAIMLSEAWVQTGDYLFESGHHIGRADWVVGNPPYIRLEDLPNGGSAYRALYPTMVGRADIYVAFFESALRQLKPEGKCGFICADRWMLNQYGAELRRFIVSGFSVDLVAEMHDALPFESDVSAYPAITILRRGQQQETVVASIGIDAAYVGGQVLTDDIEHVMSDGLPIHSSYLKASRLSSWFRSDDPWPLLDPDKLAVLQRLESSFPLLQQTSAKVSIGVATGADAIFITKDPGLVEKECLLPLAMAIDLKSSKVSWSGHYLVNPWNCDGLVDLQRFPKLAKYLESNRKKLAARHVSKKNSANWYRTIDRVNSALTKEPKLYLPDIKGRIFPVLDDGTTYPHHNIYYIEPGRWDSRVLGGILLSNVAQFFIEAYGVRMRGGYLRFQAQYLRKIRVPNPDDIAPELRSRLIEAFSNQDVLSANLAASELYFLTKSDEKALGY